MKSVPYLRWLLFCMIVVLTAACASESELVAIRLDTSHPLYQSEACQKSLAAVEAHKSAKQVRSVASPLLVVLSGGLLIPVIAANAGLETVDQVDASNLAARCGGKAKSSGEIAGKVVQGAALSVVGGMPNK